MIMPNYFVLFVAPLSLSFQLYTGATHVLQLLLLNCYIEMQTF